MTVSMRNKWLIFVFPDWLASWLKQKKAHLNVKTEDSRIQEMKAYVEDLSEHLKGVLKTRIKIKEQIFASKHVASSFAR